MTTSEEDWDRASLTTLGIGPAAVSTHLEQLLASDPEERRRASDLLYCEVANQGQLYGAAVLCVDFLAGHTAAGGRQTPESIALLESILNARSPGLRAVRRGNPVDVAEYCREGILKILPEILRSADGRDAGFFREVCFLIPQLADSSDSVIEFLTAATSDHQGELRRLAGEALEEAEDVSREGHMA
ncbi:hypothetical protein [Streptomyces griseoluteus]|uniref:hypothetical protein n=1 Tax=Streptomyces griseoluteus TaxID=29306 RepID=UPI0036EB046B